MWVSSRAMNTAPLSTMLACAAAPSPRVARDALVRRGGRHDARDVASPDVLPDDDDVPIDRPLPPDVARAEADEARAARRTACAYGPRAWAVETLRARGAHQVADVDRPHVLVLMQENRSFDHYFRTLPQSGQANVDVASDDWSNPGADGTPGVRFHHDTARNRT